MRISDWSSDVCSSDLNGLADHVKTVDRIARVHHPQSRGVSEVRFGRLRMMFHRTDSAATGHPNRQWRSGSASGAVLDLGPLRDDQIGSASCRKRVWKYVKISVVAVSKKKKKKK